MTEPAGFNCVEVTKTVGLTDPAGATCEIHSLCPEQTNRGVVQ